MSIVVCWNWFLVSIVHQSPVLRSGEKLPLHNPSPHFVIGSSHREPIHNWFQFMCCFCGKEQWQNYWDSGMKTKAELYEPKNMKRYLFLDCTEADNCVSCSSCVWMQNTRVMSVIMAQGDATTSQMIHHREYARKYDIDQCFMPLSLLTLLSPPVFFLLPIQHRLKSGVRLSDFAIQTPSCGFPVCSSVCDTPYSALRLEMITKAGWWSLWGCWFWINFLDCCLTKSLPHNLNATKGERLCHKSWWIRKRRHSSFPDVVFAQCCRTELIYWQKLCFSTSASPNRESTLEQTLATETDNIPRDLIWLGIIFKETGLLFQKRTETHCVVFRSSCEL